MRADGVQEDELQVDIAFDEVDSGFVIVAVQQIQILHARKVMQPILYDVSVDHLLIGLLHLVNLLLHLIFEDIIEMGHVLQVGRTHSIAFPLVQSLDKEHLQRRQLHDSRVTVFSCEIGVVDTVTSHSTGNPSSVSTVFLDSLTKRNEVAFALAHLFSLDVNVSVAVVAARPVFLVFPNCSVIE